TMCIAIVFLMLFAGSNAGSSSRFTNIVCESLDVSFVRFDECNLKLLGRGIVGLNVYAALLQFPVKVSKINVSFFKKYNGYRPFIYNVTLDICKYLDKKRDKLSFEKIFLDLALVNSNINHSCPYEHDIIVRNLVFENKFIKFLPLPTGDYKFELRVSGNNNWIAFVKTFFYVFR
ncbi:hypothetical protein KR044_009015, partial [Drosophila immigrans]